MTNKRTFLMGLGALALTGIAAPAAAQQLSLNAISSYMNGLQTAQGGFTQINADGTLSTGQIYIKRPGRKDHSRAERGLWPRTHGHGTYL